MIEALKTKFQEILMKMIDERANAATWGQRDMFTNRQLPTQTDIRKKYMPLLKDIAACLSQYGVDLNDVEAEALEYEPPKPSMFDSE